MKSGTDSNELSGTVSAPYGPLNVRASADWSESVTPLSPLTELFSTTYNVSGGLDWTVLSSKTGATVADLTLSHRGEDRYINGLTLSDQDVSAVSNGVSFRQQFERGTVGGRIGFTAGIPLFNGDEDADGIDAFTPRNRFFKLDGALNASYVIPERASFSSVFFGQWANTPLLDDDQITIGSRTSVRGYSSASFKADRGAVWRNEVAFAMPAVLTPKWAEDRFALANPYLFVDAGLGHDLANDFTGHRVSSGLGLRYGGKRLSFDLGYAFRLAANTSPFDDDVPGELFVNLRMKIF